jgi:hypothetical protein
MNLNSIFSDSDHFKKNVTRSLSITVVVAVLAAAFCAMTEQHAKPLLDLHSFRQTQTAISAFYMMKDSGTFIDYVTPVLGKPWRIPMEIPLYQWLVARWENLFGHGLDQSGKLVSTILWIVCFWPINLLLKELKFSNFERCVCICILYSSPLYLYWGRAFMMESTVLLLCLAMTSSALIAQRKSGFWWGLCAGVFSYTGGVCKVTTWAVSVVVTGLLLIYVAGVSDLKKLRRAAATMIAVLAPILPIKLWLNYGDSVKALNPFARTLLLASSDSQWKWNFGTLQQRLDPATWLRFYAYFREQLAVPGPRFGGAAACLILLLGSCAAPKRMPLTVIFLLGFLTGPLVFTNLYFVHNYYWFANSIWLLLALANSLIGLLALERHTSSKIIVGTAVLFITASGFWAWSERFLPLLKGLPEREKLEEAWGLPVRKIVPEGRTILIVGNDWDPTAMYYSQRKGVALPNGSNAFPNSQLEESIANLTPEESLGAVVFTEATLSPENQPLITRTLLKLGMSTQGSRTAFGVLFPALDLVNRR